MTSPTLELQGAIVTRLKAHGPLTAIVGPRIYDAVPKKDDFPRVTLGPTEEVSDDVDCIDGFEVTLQIDCWSQAVGFPEVRRMADAVRRALKAGVALSDNALVYLNHRTTRTFRDSDGQTSRAALTFEAFIEQP
ncbi:DUF3168 domain-containing protein [Tianweitania sediminis]|uniref:DUF3168 domain-containing protein n=1 Tax=Tianweitania sediminis TaxID=1502156 RepID=A0A8J7RJG5_9HYPH|nr:DUF3168 domain-containing protein [Tianweitania sediminis]MBP0439586.1 DUF3168 domain-containing protein [Tianweitania sediminis]